MSLKDEFEELVHGADKVGHWMLLRHFTDEYSSYWNPETHEAVGGPARLYTDTPIEVYTASIAARSAIRTQGLQLEEAAAFDEGHIKIFMNADVPVAKTDEIFELDYAERTPPTIVYQATAEDAASGIVCPKERYKVQYILKYRETGGQVAYKVALVYETVLR